ncbi:hypothetical protein [Fluviicola chungangensis]|uniref:Carboxypeptidase regulatory-like domain-containing protein n=1 Tax=Fluviicola chungangensis TaxID=2597671 RepID=A0A556N041_9FLAO|nr:hypothetical protein [Fluviicola chungangensis]TSJ45448.1 hypothetical protein FO442_06750 [Fluviicola chungangensis]
MKQNNLFVLILCFVTLTTCTKFGKNVYVDGRVYNPITGEGIEGVPIKLYRTKIDSKDPIGTSYKTLETTTTDANGYYKLEHLTSPFKDVFVQLNSEDNYPVGWVDYGNTGEAKVKKGKRNHLDYQMLPFGEIKISIHNINCQGPNDTLIYKRNYVSLSGISAFQPFTLTGCYDNDGAFAKVPSGDYLVEWTVIRNGISNSYSHIVTVPGNGQVTYNIDY